MIERKYHCKTCGGEWRVPNSASQHHRRYPDHEIEVLDINTETGEVKPNPFITGKGTYKKMANSSVIKGPPEVGQHGDGPGPTDLQPPKFVMVGTIRMPLEDFGYSSPLNFLRVLTAYDKFKREFEFPGKMGDFCALMVQIIEAITGSLGGDEHDPGAVISAEVHQGEGSSKPGEN